MTTVGEAVRAIGIVADDGDIIIVRPSARGMNHFRLPEVEDKILEEDCYFATGTYGPGTVSRHSGRIAANLLRINELPFDFDLADSTGIPKDELWQYSDAALWPLIEALHEEVETAFGAIGLTLHRIDYTGYGLAGYLRLPLHKPEAIPAIQDLHARIVKRINTIARVKLCDPQVVDAGTRIMRLPGCLNTKGAIPRRTRTLVQRAGMVNEAALTIAAGATSTMAARIVPVTGAVLDEATVNQLIDAVQPHWNLGQKHNLALALSGLLAKAGVPEEQTLAIVQVLSAGDEKPWDREKCVHTSYEKVRAGQKVKGFHGLQDTLPVELVSWLDNLAQRVYQASKPRLTAHGESYEGARAHAINEEPRTNSAVFFEPPVSAFDGWVGDYCELVTPTTEAPTAFQLGVALTVVGAMMGRHVGVKYNSDPLFANLFTVLVGRSNKTRKDTAIKRAVRTLSEPITSNTSVLNHGITVIRDVGSSTALLNDLKEHQNVLLYMTEFARLIGNARRKSTETITPTLMEAFDTPPVMHNKSMMSPIEARFPYLSMLVAVQPEILTGLMTSDDMASGFANRLLFICGSPTAPMPIAPDLDWTVMRSLFQDIWKVRQSYSEGKLLEMDEEAKALWIDWYVKDWHAEANSAEEEALKQRHHVFIQKIALIYTLCEGRQRIAATDLQRGMDIVSWMWRNITMLSGEWGRSTNGQIEERIRAVLERNGPMKRREVQRLASSRKWDSTDFAKVFDAMVRNQTVVADPFGLVALNHE